MPKRPPTTPLTGQRDKQSIHFGAWLKKQRDAQNLSQLSVGELAGLSATHLGRIERGDATVPKPETVIRLARAVHADPIEACKQAGIYDQLPESVRNDMKLKSERARDISPAADAFRAKLIYGQADKNAIATKVVEALLVRNAIDSIWLSDGTQTAVTMQAYLDYWTTVQGRPYPIDIATNSVHMICKLSSELEQKLTLSVAPGTFYPEHSAILGPETDKYVSEKTSGRLVVFSATALDFDLGPAAYHAPLRSQKRAILNYSKDRDVHLLLLVQANKLSRPPSEVDTSVVSKFDWNMWITEDPERLRVATSLDPPVYNIVRDVNEKDLGALAPINFKALTQDLLNAILKLPKNVDLTDDASQKLPAIAVLTDPEKQVLPSIVALPDHAKQMLPAVVALSAHQKYQLRNGLNLKKALKENFIFVEAVE